MQSDWREWKRTRPSFSLAVAPKTAFFRVSPASLHVAFASLACASPFRFFRPLANLCAALRSVLTPVRVKEQARLRRAAQIFSQLSAHCLFSQFSPICFLPSRTARFSLAPALQSALFAARRAPFRRLRPLSDVPKRTASEPSSARLQAERKPSAGCLRTRKGARKLPKNRKDLGFPEVFFDFSIRRVR